MKKTLNKIMAFAVAMIIVLAMAMPAMAQTVGTATDGTGSITITNAAKGEEYKVYKIFSATVDGEGAISYTGEIPTALANYFTKDSVGVIRKNTEKSDSAIAKAVADYVATLTSGEVAKATSDGTSLTFAGLAFGYYGVTSSQGAAVTVDSTNPNVDIIDKNSVTTIPVKKVNGKDVDDVHIGETVTYTAKFGPLANFINEKDSDGTEVSLQVQSYTIDDTLPEFLKDIKITEVKVYDGDPDATENAGTLEADLSSSYTAFNNKKIVIPWVDNNTPAASLYANKSYITIKYTAVIASDPVINTVGASEANINTVTITPNKDKTGDEPFKEHWSDDAEVKTYGAAVKKIDAETKKALKGAQFTISGYEVAAEEDKGVYRITGEKTGDSIVMDTNDDGVLYILGMDNDITVTETKAPDGYNKLAAPVTLSKQVLTHEIWTTEGSRIFDAKGNIVSESSSTTTTVSVEKNYDDLEPVALKVENNKGTELPSTGGMGTTIFYVIGGILILAAAIILISRRRVQQ